MNKAINKKYNPSLVEDKIYDFWLKESYFHVSVDEGKKPYSIVIPPPNLTGVLHLGHALNNTIQDIIIRYKRMQGYNTLWLPGTDHASIAVHNIIENIMAEEGITRHELGREKFLERAWQWKEKYGNIIIEQLKKLGCSCDWKRERFTMDPGFSKAVLTAFKMFYDDGLIYQDFRMINWCPKCLTTIADIEVKREVEEGNFWYIDYLMKGEDNFITIATTRPETMLGDSAVAVHSQDKRYKSYVGKTAILPLINRELPIISDDRVDPEFGTGAVKITPAHDFNDYEIGLTHNLEQINIFDDNAKINKNIPEYKGLDRYECREKVIEDLKKLGQLRKVEKHNLAIGRHDRCNIIIEPRISKQWFVKMKSLANMGIKVVKDNEIKFIPKNWEKVYFHWMENIKDWCISRQLWWGHRIPVWYCEDCDDIMVELEPPKKCKSCESESIYQDEDVLDTWFSSALWPFSTMGWPEQTAELGYFFPTETLTTANEIIFFWVARMIMTSLYFMKKIPFRRVFIHPTIYDKFGKKMSKSLGNVIDPIPVMEKYGTDALRFTLSFLTSPGRNIALGEETIKGMRNFANKIWNAARFVQMSTEGINFKDINEDSLCYQLEDRWIISRFNITVKNVIDNLEEFNFAEASKQLYKFFWGEYCDWYIELCKNRLYQDEDKIAKKTAGYLLIKILESYLRLLHPFMPFISEEIWQSIPHDGESIMISPYPEYKIGEIDKEAEYKMEILMDVISAIREVRSQLSVSPQKRFSAYLITDHLEKKSLIIKNNEKIMRLAGLNSVDFVGKIDDLANYSKSIASGIDIFIPLLELIDRDKELMRLNNRLGEVKEKYERSLNKISNKQFLEKAPEHVILGERENLEKFKKEIVSIEEQISILKSKK